MAYKKILIPVDGSAYSDEAIAEGIELAKLADSEVTLLYVSDRPAYVQMAVGVDLEEIDRVLKEESDRVLGDALVKAGMPCETLAVDGNPGRTISELSKDYDLIVMGTAGRTGIR